MGRCAELQRASRRQNRACPGEYTHFRLSTESLRQLAASHSHVLHHVCSQTRLPSPSASTLRVQTSSRSPATLIPTPSSTLESSFNGRPATRVCWAVCVPFARMQLLSRDARSKTESCWDGRAYARARREKCAMRRCDRRSRDACAHTVGLEKSRWSAVISRVHSGPFKS